MTIFFIDVSHHDWSRRGGNLDWGRIRTDGIEVMCARASYGDPEGINFGTRHFGDFQTGAKAAGFDLRGGYHNLVKGDAASMRRQVSWFRSLLDRFDCDWAMLDIERYPELLAADAHPRFADVLRFADAWYAQTDMPLCYYLPRWIWSGHMAQPDLRQLRGPLIASDYGDNLDGLPADIYRQRGGDIGRGWTAYGGRIPDVWQFGSQCDLPGASNATDINAYRGTLAEMRTLLTGSEEGDEMRMIITKDGDGQHWLSNGITRRRISGTPDEVKTQLTDLRYLSKIGAIGPIYSGTASGAVAGVWPNTSPAFGQPDGGDVDEAALAQELAPLIDGGASADELAAAVVAKLNKTRLVVSD